MVSHMLHIRDAGADAPLCDSGNWPFFCRCTFPRRSVHTARLQRNTLSIRWLSTRPERRPETLLVIGDIRPNKQVSEVRPSPCSERRPSRPRRSRSSLSALRPRESDWRQLRDARPSFSVRPRQRVVFTEHFRAECDLGLKSIGSGCAPVNASFLIFLARQNLYYILCDFRLLNRRTALIYFRI